MHNGYFLGVDVGSASVRAGVYSASGRRLAFATAPVSQFRHGGERVEQSSAEIWQQVCKAVKEATALAGIPISAIRSLGFDATCSLVVLDEQGRGLAVSPSGSANHDIIMWMDHRATVETAQINATNDPALRYVGGEVSVEMELPKLRWLKTHLPQTRRQLIAFSIWRIFWSGKQQGETSRDYAR